MNEKEYIIKIKNGRIRLPDEVLEFCKNKKNLVLFGFYDHYELIERKELECDREFFVEAFTELYEEVEGKKE